MLERESGGEVPTKSKLGQTTLYQYPEQREDGGEGRGLGGGIRMRAAE